MALSFTTKFDIHTLTDKMCPFSVLRGYLGGMCTFVWSRLTMCFWCLGRLCWCECFSEALLPSRFGCGFRTVVLVSGFLESPHARTHTLTHTSTVYLHRSQTHMHLETWTSSLLSLCLSISLSLFPSSHLCTWS